MPNIAKLVKRNCTLRELKFIFQITCLRRAPDSRSNIDYSSFCFLDDPSTSRSTRIFLALTSTPKAIVGVLWRDSCTIYILHLNISQVATNTWAEVWSPIGFREWSVIGGEEVALCFAGVRRTCRTVRIAERVTASWANKRHVHLEFGSTFPHSPFTDEQDISDKKDLMQRHTAYPPVNHTTSRWDASPDSVPKPVACPRK